MPIIIFIRKRFSLILYNKAMLNYNILKINNSVTQNVIVLITMDYLQEIIYYVIVPCIELSYN